MAGLSERVLKLKKEEDAVILAHNYQKPEIQDVADFTGDSLDLARKAGQVDEKYIIFAGVDFMAEGAAIMNPDKTVIIPDVNARCPMAAQLPAKEVIKAKKKHPGIPVVLYVNTLAEAKAEADITCTSANCVNIINSVKGDEVMFGPDRNLAYYVQQRTKKKVIPIPEDGYCIVHKHLLSYPDVMMLKQQHPDALLLAHPECEPEIQEKADYILSTGGMVKKAGELDSREFIIATEEGICHRLRKENPGKRFYCLDYAVCRNMKLHTLEKVYDAIKNKAPVVRVDERVAARARKAIESMLDVRERD
ncbi:MAG: quinolinate synthase NadA [Candidatus Altiarchaeota archaeon]